MLSYYVLVGPYEDDRVQAERKRLASHGFKPRAFEAGSRNLSVYGGCVPMSRLLRSSLTLNRVGMPAADCLISWESYSNHAIVRICTRQLCVCLQPREMGESQPQVREGCICI